MYGSEDEDNMSPEQRAHLLKRRLKEDKRTINDVWRIFKHNSNYFVLNCFVHSLVAASFIQWNTRYEMVSSPSSDFQYPTEMGTKMFKHQTLVTEDGQTILEHGKVDANSFKVLQHVANIVGCVISGLTHNFSHSNRIIVLGVICVSVYLMSLGSVYNFSDRLFYLINISISKSVQIICLQCAFENGPKPWRVFSLAHLNIMTHGIGFVKLLIYNKYDIQISEQLLIFYVIAALIVYTLLAPPPLVQSILNRDFVKLKFIVKKFSSGSYAEKVNIETIVDDILYVGHLPKNLADGVSYLMKIRPFRNKLFQLIFVHLIYSSQDQIGFYIIRNFLPFTSYEGLFINYSVCVFAFISVVVMLALVKRRVVLITFAIINLVTLIFITNRANDTTLSCFSTPHPSAQNMDSISALFFFYILSKTVLKFVIAVRILEHIPAIYRSFAYPLVMAAEAFLELLINMVIDSVNIFGSNSHIYVSLFFSIISFSLIIMYVDNSSFSPFSTADIKCYKVTTDEKDLAARKRN